MIEVKVKTVWQGKVALREKYVHQALETGKGIRISVGDAYMHIPGDEVKKRIVAKSEESFYDKFSKERHFLIYFDWKPVKQQTLL